MWLGFQIWEIGLNGASGILWLGTLPDILSLVGSAPAFASSSSSPPLSEKERGPDRARSGRKECGGIVKIGFPEYKPLLSQVEGYLSCGVGFRL